MTADNQGPGRRCVLASIGALGVAAGLGPADAATAARAGPMPTKPIPATGERLPVIGMGSWLTFNVGDDTALRDARVAVLREFFAAGGGLIDSSPMYGSSEEVIGYCLERLPETDGLFSATKVWTVLQPLGIRQMEASEHLWAPEAGFDLMQIHNLLDWQAHLETLTDWKARGRVRYVGVTTSHGRRHPDMVGIMTRQPVDFVQFTYNILNRRAEQVLLPLAAERGLAVIVNRPFERGRLFDQLQRHPLPGWAAEIDCANWAQFLLKFAVSHPAVTCAIPATSRTDHMVENMGAAYGRLPDAEMRARMVRYVEGL